ncbi:MAG: hypothetical protein A3H59_01240 [Candidatus Jacksonbacteria bacterium RIFCSPLOWO2_02_FULL_43_9]|nr:MAG: hypothetical protein A2986_01945 [Candidatus Jacksonbacteria bacterium RIFCSPLOWO2_01_FULL_44_13]OGY72181.1 MAG: hypothetical protein A3H59_01240 [Candidatus Jacksonbacteria bacterium RIFCSPLOWO2_02_FULL_43_9]
MIYAIFMSVMFGSAGIIFYRTYVPPSGGTVPSSPVIQNSISGAPSPAGTIQQPTQINQQKPSVELLEDPFFAGRVAVPGFGKLEQGSLDVVDSTQALPVRNVTVYDIGTGADVLVTWEHPKDSRVQEISIYRSEDATSLGSSIAVIKNTKQTYRDSDVQLGKTYTYTVGSRAEDIQEGLSESISITVTDTVVPPSPKDITVTATDSRSVRVKWTGVDDSSVVLYRVYRSQTSGVLGDEIATVGADKPLWYDDTLVVPGNSYYYTVIAVDVGGNSSAPRQMRPNIGNPYPFGR